MIRLGFFQLWMCLSSFSADYVFCLLGDGPKSGSFSKEESQAMQKEHMQHINRMWEAGVLESAGPVAKLDGVRGIFVFSVDSAQAKAWAAKDPKVIAGDLSLDCFAWKGPDGVGKDYRARYGKPGFAAQFRGYVGVLGNGPSQSPCLAKGPIQAAKWKHFEVCETAPEAASGATVFTWFHDAQVWPATDSK